MQQVTNSKKRGNLAIELFTNRSLIFKLAKNDFKTRYAGSYLGILWAFVQPVVTVLVYWLVFEFGFNQKAEVLKEGIAVPYVMYLTAGLVPWFYFSEAINNGMTSLLEYNYLVKKVVFKISILPLVKIMAAGIIHCFFVGVLLIVCMIYGFFPVLSWIQIPYYSICLFVLVLALSYTLSSVIIFFRDLGQIINIGLQVGMWATPILWPISILDNHPAIQFIFRLNPVYYIVSGYRGSLFEKKWFFDDLLYSAYFWGFTVIVFAMGAFIFKRLKPHFADVL